MNTHHQALLKDHNAVKTVPECYVQLACAIVGTHKTNEKFKALIHPPIHQ